MTDFDVVYWSFGVVHFMLDYLSLDNLMVKFLLFFNYFIYLWLENIYNQKKKQWKNKCNERNQIVRD